MDSPADPAVQIRGLNWAYVLMGVADGTLLPFIPLYLFERGLNAAWIGLVLAVAASPRSRWAWPGPTFADRRFSPERMVVIASIAAALVALLLPVAGGAASVAVVIPLRSPWRASPFMLLDPITLRRLRVGRATDYARIRLRMSAGWAASAVGSARCSRRPACI